jgi:antitoxin (DNA-binding transcriptional repressor) of toxin-antitoxin stability system
MAAPVIRLNVHEAKTHLSRYLVEVERGRSILLCRNNKPVAEIKRLVGRPTVQRPVGLAKGTFRLTEAFFQPLPEDLLSAFEGT